MEATNYPAGVTDATIDRLYAERWECETCGTCDRKARIPREWLKLACKDEKCAYCPVEHNWVKKGDAACREWRPE